MAQELGAFAALTEDPGSIPSKHMTVKDSVTPEPLKNFQKKKQTYIYLFITYFKISFEFVYMCSGWKM